MQLENTPLYELEIIMQTYNMKIFCAAVNELVKRNSEDVYRVLKKYLDISDKYKKRFVLSVIFEFPEAIELCDRLEQTLKYENDKNLMLNTILNILIKYHIKLSDELILEVLRENDFDYGWYYQAIAYMDRTESNVNEILALYRKKCTSARIVIAEQLEVFVTDENYIKLFQLFKDDEQPHIRMSACRIVEKMNRKDLLMMFKNDRDGHIRKYVERHL